MSKLKLHPLPHSDPVTGAELYVSELSCEESGVTIRGHFAIPKFSMLDKEQSKFLETFLRCRGMLSSVEKELGMSYPTVRARLDSLLDALDLIPIKESTRSKEKDVDIRRRILDELERGEITAEEAKARIREGA